MAPVRYRSIAIRFILITIGIVVDSIAIIVFLSPFDIAPSGVTGLALILNRLINTPIGLMVLVMNIPIQYLAYRMLGGWRIVALTIYVLVVYSFSLDLIAPLLPTEGITDNALLGALFGGIIGGISGGLVYRAGGTFGGTSTLALILQHRLGTPMSTTYLYTDTAVIGIAALVFGWEAALYALVALFVSGLATDYALEGPSVIRTAVIVTDRPREVADVIMNRMERGATSWQVTGMYTEQPHSILYVVVSRSEMRTLRQLVVETDPSAFIVIGQGHSAYGEGFKRPVSSALDG
jgi:uncharacterized membrane-anchored protein YitT (DUF2179 family)